MKLTPVVLVVLGMAGCAGNTIAPSTAPPVASAVVETEAHYFHAARFEATVLIEVSVPAAGIAAAEGVIIALDGAATFPIVAATAAHLTRLGEMPSVVVIGLHTQTLASVSAPELADFVATDVNRFLRSEYGVDTSTGVLVGYGRAGADVLAALFDLPSRFARYLVVSPVLLDDSVAQLEAAYANNHTDLPARVFIGIGGLETDPHAGVARTAAVALTKEIRHLGFPNLHNETVIFEGENHASVLPAAVSRGLRYLFRE